MGVYDSQKLAEEDKKCAKCEAVHCFRAHDFRLSDFYSIGTPCIALAMGYFTTF